MVLYISLDQLNEQFLGAESASDYQKTEAIESASRMIERWARREVDYFADVSIFSDGVPLEIQYAVKKYTVHILRSLDPVMAASAGVTGADGANTIREVREIAEMYRPTAANLADDTEYESRNVPVIAGWL